MVLIACGVSTEEEAEEDESDEEEGEEDDDDEEEEAEESDEEIRRADHRAILRARRVHPAPAPPRTKTDSARRRARRAGRRCSLMSTK